MPTLQTHRNWCMGCQDWAFFSDRFPKDEKVKCDTCDKEFEPYYLYDLPKEKVMQQRERYKEYKKRQTEGVFNLMLSGGLLRDNPFSSSFPKSSIIEADAGQKELDEAKAKLREIEWQEQKRLREERRIEAQKYAHLGRNDMCACGSGIKFKKCHLDKITYD